ncbi:MAG: histidine kinase [Actinomycetota bacterium]|nr:histidine kinase [Actinomycetota bacterium]
MARQATARVTRSLSGWLRSTLPGVAIDAPDEERGRQDPLQPAQAALARSLLLRDRVVDATMYLVAFVFAAIGLVDTWELHPPWLRVVAIVVGIAAPVSLRWRRTHPAAVGIGVGVVALVIYPAGVAALVATFNAAIRARGRDLAIIAGLMVAWAFANPLLYPPDIGYWLNAGVCLLVAAVAIGWGLFVRARRELVRSLRAQADRAGDEARAAERRRIAREMHDVLAHRLSLLSVHAGALEFNPDAPPEEVGEAAGVIRESARAALDELRSVIGVLREDGGDGLTQPPQPTLADLAALVEESRAAGMRITARIELGAAAPAAAVGRTAYRIAQEGLTNARKHAPGAAVTLTVRAPDGDLRVEIRSLAPVVIASASPLPGAGTGLIGLAERVTLAGGELESGVDPAGAFVLRARLPR